MYEELYFNKEINRLFPTKKDEIIFIYKYTGEYLYGNKWDKYNKYLYDQDPRKKNIEFQNLFSIIKNYFENIELIRFIHTKSINVLEKRF